MRLLAAMDPGPGWGIAAESAYRARMQHRTPGPPRASYIAALAAAAMAAVGSIAAPQGGTPRGDTPKASAPKRAAATQRAAPKVVAPQPAKPQAEEPAVNPATLVRASVEPALVHAPGGGEAIAISITVAPEWHIYWRNPGDSGAAPSVKLELPEGWTLGSLTYPRPEIFGDSEERTFGYSGSVHLLVPVTRPEGWEGTLDVRGELSWLACRRSCVAGRSPLAAQLFAMPDALPDAPASRTWPSSMPSAATVELKGEGAARTLAVSIPGVPESETVRLIPDDCAGVRWADGSGPHDFTWDGAKSLWTLQTPISVIAGAASGGVPRARGLVLLGTESTRPAYLIDIPVPAAPTLPDPEPGR